MDAATNRVPSTAPALRWHINVDHYGGEFDVYRWLVARQILSLQDAIARKH